MWNTGFQGGQHVPVPSTVAVAQHGKGQTLTPLPPQTDERDNTAAREDIVHDGRIDKFRTSLAKCFGQYSSDLNNIREAFNS